MVPFSIFDVLHVAMLQINKVNVFDDVTALDGLDRDERG